MPNEPPASVATITVAPRNVRLRNRRRSSIGSGCRSSTRTNAASDTSPAATHPSTGALVHPSALPRNTAKTIRKRPVDNVTTPPQSTGLGSGSRDSRTLVSASPSVGRPSATPSQKIACQPKLSTSSPPTSGPAANASPMTAPHVPIARARAEPSNSCTSSASEAGKSIAAPSPCSARAAISSPDDHASAHSADAVLNTISPSTNSRLRPNRSARLPAVSWKTASTSE